MATRYSLTKTNRRWKFIETKSLKRNYSTFLILLPRKKSVISHSHQLTMWKYLCRIVLLEVLRSVEGLNYRPRKKMVKMLRRREEELEEELLIVGRILEIGLLMGLKVFFLGIMVLMI